MSKKLTSTLLLFAVFLGFLLWGISRLVAPPMDGDSPAASIVYTGLLFMCSFVALVAILKLPYKNQS